MSRFAVRDLAIVLAASWLARIAFVAAIGDAHSLDVDYWQGALATQDEGTNPYETGVLNWPPFWLQIIVALDAAANLVDVSFLTALRVYLVLVESAIVVALYLTLVSVGASRAAVRRALLVGIALNPVTIILVCQHGNSDVNIGLLVTLTAAALIAHWRSRDVVLWLGGCLLLGLGVLAKTAPLVLAPVLAPGARIASRSGRVLGAALLLGPAALGVSVILALSPRATLDHVIGYRSTRGFWGFSGILDEVTTMNSRYALGMAVLFASIAAVVWLWGNRAAENRRSTQRYLFALLTSMLVVVFIFGLLDRWTTLDLRGHYSSVFTLGIAAMVAWLGHRLWREAPLAPPRLFLLIAVIFLIVVAFGPGYGAHYFFWFLPALIATYVLLDDAWRRLLLVAYVIAVLTYAIEYGFIPFLGSWTVAMFGSAEWMVDFADYLSTPHRWVLFRLPLFVAYLVVIAAGISRLARSDASERLAPS
jgi:hypothetical protein